MEKLKEIIGSGRLGILVSAQVVYHDYFIPPAENLDSDRRSQWRTALSQAGGGTLNETGCHRIDLLLYLLGPAHAVSAEIDRFEAWYEGEDQASITIRFANRVIAQADHSWCARSPRDLFVVAGTHGQVIVEDLDADRLFLQVGESVEVVDVDHRPSATHRPLVADFCRALHIGSPIRCTGWDGLRATQVIEVAYQAAREGRRLRVPPLQFEGGVS